MTKPCLQRKTMMQSRRGFLRTCIFACSAFMFGKWAFGRVFDPFPWDAGLNNLTPCLHIIPRSAWSTFEPVLSRLNQATDFSRLTVHHAGNMVNTHIHWDSVVHDLNGILGAHMHGDYGDIGYHFIIDYAGRIWEGRPLFYEGAHVSGQNIENIGVMLLGNFEEQRPAPDQISSLFKLVNALIKKYSISKDSIYGHCDLGQSICPGKYLYKPYVGQLQTAELGPYFGIVPNDNKTTSI